MFISSSSHDKGSESVDIFEGMKISMDSMYRHLVY